MPTTSEMITEIQQEAHNYTREGKNGLLYYFNNVHRFMMSQDVEQMIETDPATGRFPIIQTEENVFEYETDSDIRRVAGLLVDAYVTNNKTSQFFFTYYNKNNAWPWSVDEIFVTGHPYWLIPLRTIDARPGKNAKFTFVYNPEDNTAQLEGIYMLLAYLKPTEITSENIQVDVPEKYHDLLVDGTLARIKKRDYGDDRAYEQWKTKILKDFVPESNKGHQTSLNFVPPRYE